MVAEFVIESMHGKRDAVITNGITELSEKLGRDDGMDEPFWEPSCYSVWWLTMILYFPSFLGTMASAVKLYSLQFSM